MFKILKQRLESLPDVSDVELAAGQQRIVEAITARTDAQQQVERLQSLEYQAREWANLQARLSQRGALAEGGGTPSGRRRHRTSPGATAGTA